MSNVTKVEDLPTPEELVNWALENDYTFKPYKSGESGCALNALAKYHGKPTREKMIATSLGELLGMDVGSSYAVACAFDMGSIESRTTEYEKLSLWALAVKALAKEKGVYQC